MRQLALDDSTSGQPPPLDTLFILYSFRFKYRAADELVAQYQKPHLLGRRNPM